MHAALAPALFDLVTRIAGLHCLSDVWRAYLAAARHAGLPHGILFATSGLKPMRQQLLGADMPEGWLENYEARDYAAHCPLMARTRIADQPFQWQVRDWDQNLTPIQQSWRDDTLAAGITGGVGVPWRGGSANRAILLGGNIDKLAPQDLDDLHFAGMAVLQRVETLSAPQALGPALSPRERECLTWVALGKNDGEIGTILSMSQKTVNVYVERAKHKLDAATRTQAVVKALQAGQITL